MKKTVKTVSKKRGRPVKPKSDLRRRLCGGPFVAPDVYRRIERRSKAKGVSIGEAIDQLVREAGNNNT